jgi:solute:Na+ symporter, SSS family
LLICVIPVCLGVLGKTAGIIIPPGSSVFMNVAQALTNPWMAALIACAVLMAILSTAISLLNAVSSNLTQDFDLMSERGSQSVQWARGITLTIGLLAVFCSFYAGEIVGLLIQSYELSVCCLFVPVCGALFQRNVSVHSAWLAIILGGIGFGLSRVMTLEIPSEVFSLALSGLGYALGEGAKQMRLV